MNNAIAGLTFDAPKGTASFRVVSNDRNACPDHFGVFLDRADAVTRCAAVNADAAAAGLAVPVVKVVAFKVR